jgi:hypothetical protein
MPPLHARNRPKGARWRTWPPTLPSRIGGRRCPLPTAHIRRLRILTTGGRKGKTDGELGRNQPHEADTAPYYRNHDRPDDCPDDCPPTTTLKAAPLPVPTATPTTAHPPATTATPTTPWAALTPPAAGTVAGHVTAVGD